MEFLNDKSNVADNIDYLIELSLGTKTDYKYWEGGGGGHRNISINFLWSIYDKNKKSIANGEVTGRTECYKWECTTDNETAGESAESVLMKTLFVPDYQLSINSHLQKLYTLAFSSSLHSALKKLSTDIAEHLK